MRAGQRTLALRRKIGDHWVTYYFRCNGAVLSPGDVMSTDDAIWGAMNDPSRRAILDLLRSSSMTTGQLCSYFSFSRFAVMKHLKVLEQSGLVISERRGRSRINHLNPIPLQEIYHRWVKPFEQLSADRLLRVKALAEKK